MDSLKDLVSSSGFQPKKLTAEDAQVFARELGLVLTDEQALHAYRELRDYVPIKKACDSCTGIESCKIGGYSAILKLEPRASLGYFECDKSKAVKKQSRLTEMLVASMIPEKLKGMSLKGYETGDNQKAVEAARHLVKDKTCRGIALYGPPGVGKTHLGIAIVNNRLILEQSALYVTVPQLFKAIGASYGDKTYDELMENLCSVELLMLDDLGVEKPSENRIEELVIIVNTRSNENRQMIVTTNLSLMEVMERYGTRIASRLADSCDWYEIKGHDRRMAGRTM